MIECCVWMHVSFALVWNVALRFLQSYFIANSSSQPGAIEYAT